jgi:subtilisin family serine protease
MKHALFVFLFTISAFLSKAQFSRYRVELRDKGATTYSLSNAGLYLSQRAIARRERYQIPIDSSDLPIPAVYISQIQTIPQLVLLNQSKWLNAVTVETNDPQALATLEALPFVKAVEGIAARNPQNGRWREEEINETIPDFPSARPGGTQGNYFDYGTASLAEINLHNGQFLHNVGLRGQGLQIAMLDGGFFNFANLRSFDSAVANNQFLSSWDFVAREASVQEDHPHGMMCLSTIVANIPGQFVGKAPKASFHLFRTEDVGSEYPIEEFNWVCAAERADSVGADIISSSLGYGYEWSSPVPDYPYSDLNGDATIAARGADLAASKGMLVFNSAGNSGNDYWKMITTPADGDSVIAVGAVNSNGQVGSFSSYGPSADGRVKPDMASVGVSAILQSTSNLVGSGNGTSYACPNLAGLATCLWQAFPEFSNMQIVEAMKQSANKFANPDNRTGYGIPDMKIAFARLLKKYAESEAEFNNCRLTIRWQTKDAAGMRYILERKGPQDTDFNPVISWESDGSSILSDWNYTRTFDLNETEAGSVQFRIKQVIDTSMAGYAFVLLDTITASVNHPCPVPTTNSVLLAPNPATSRTQIGLQISLTEAKENVLVQVFNSAGMLIGQTRRSLSAAQQYISIETSYRSAGLYYVRLFDHNKEWATLTLKQD